MGTRYTDDMVRDAIEEVEGMDDWACPIFSLMAGRPMPCMGNCAWYDRKDGCVVFRLNVLSALSDIATNTAYIG